MEGDSESEVQAVNVQRGSHAGTSVPGAIALMLKVAGLSTERTARSGQLHFAIIFAAGKLVFGEGRPEAGSVFVVEEGAVDVRPEFLGKIAYSVLKDLADPALVGFNQLILI